MLSLKSNSIGFLPLLFVRLQMALQKFWNFTSVSKLVGFFEELASMPLSFITQHNVELLRKKFPELVCN